jgi:C4-dicarboxylate transporter DctM subunit
MLPWELSGVLLALSLLILLVIGCPIAVALGLLGTAGMFIVGGVSGLSNIVGIAFHHTNSFVLSCLPLFIFMAEILLFTEMSKDLFDVGSKWMGWIPGGLLHSSVFSCSIFAAITGSSAAESATIGLVAIPEMVSRDYDKKLTMGTLAGGATLGILIPPSMAFIIYGLTVEESIGQLFIAGVIPGIIMALSFSAYIIFRVLRNPGLAPSIPKISWRERIFSLARVWHALLLILAVLGSIYLGVGTPAEAAALGVVGALIIAIAYRKITLENLTKALLQGSKTSVFVIFLIIGAVILGHLLAILEIPQNISRILTGLEISRWLVLAMVQLLWLGLGMLLEPISIMVITLPLLHPAITALGFDSIWFGVVMVLNMEIACITPPVGVNLYILKGIAPPEVSLAHIIRGSVPFVLILIGGMVLLAFFPQLALFLPSLMK